MKPYELSLYDHTSGWKLITLTRREQADGAKFPIHPTAKICPYCLRIWAVFEPVEGAKGFHYSIHSTACLSCSNQWQVKHPWYLFPNIPGTLLYDTSYQATDWDLLEDLPPALAHYEAKLHLEFHEQSNKPQTNPRLTSNTKWYLLESIDSSTLATIDTRTGTVTPSRCEVPPPRPGRDG